MAKSFKTGLIITGDADGGVRAVRATSSEIRKLNKDFDTGAKRARAFGDQTRETSRELEFLKQHALSVGTAIAGAFAANNLAQQAVMIRNTDALANSLQVSTKTIQEWQFAGRSVGLEADKIGDIFKDVSDKLGDFAATGGGEAKDLIENLNLNVRELLALSPDKQILRIADAINEIEDPSQRSFYFESLADEMVRLQPLLADGARGLKEASDMADALGIAMDDIEVRRAVEAAEAMDQLQGVAQGLSNTLIADLGPGLAESTRNLTQFIEGVGGADEVLEGVGQTISVLASVYLARRLGPGLLSVGKRGMAAGSQIAQGFAMAVGASGRLNQALVVTQGRIAATAAAGRALRSSLALIGGPAGAALLAAGGIYTFREELGLTIPRADASSEAVHQLTGELNDLNKAAAEKKLTELNNRLADLKATAEDAGQAALDVGKQDTGHGGILGADVAGQVKELQEISETAKPVRQDVANVEEAIELVRDRLEHLNSTGERTPPVLTNIGDASEEAAKRAEQYANSLRSLLDELNPVEKSQREFRQSQILLQTALLKGSITIEEYFRNLQKLENSYRNAGNAAEVYGFDGSRAMEKVEDSVDPMATAFERGIERMDDAAVDMWRSFLDGSEGAFDSFKNLALDTLAEVIHAYTTRQITANISGMIGGGQEGSSAGSAGGANMPSVSNVGSLWNTAQNAYAGWTGTFGSQLGMQGGVSGTAIGSANAVVNGTGASGAWNSAVGGAGGAAGGSSLGWTSYGSGGGWAGGLANMGAGMAASYAGGQVGNWAGEAAFGKTANSSYGQTAGAAIGSIWGPIGTGVGAAIGSAVDVLFGSNEKTYDFDFQQGGQYGVFGDRESELGKFGVTSFSDYKRGEQQDQLNELMTSIEQFDNELAAAAVPKRVDAMSESIKGFTHDDPEDLFTDRLRAIIDGSGAIAEDAIENIADGEKLTQAILASLRIESVGQSLSEQMMGEIEQWISGADNITAAATSMSQAAQTAQILVDAGGRLDVQFDATAQGAIHAASELASAAGGVDQLTSLQQSYYQAVSSQTEQAARSYSNVYDALQDITDQVPTTVGEYRRLVKAQDINTEAGRQTRLQLMQLAPAFAEVAGSVEDVITSVYEDVLNRAPDASGLEYYVDAIESGGLTVAQALDQIRNSSEAASVAADGAADSIQDQADATRLAEQRARMEIELLRLQGREAEATRREREAELDTLHDSLDPLQKRIWAMEDAAKAEEEARQAAEERAQAMRDAEQTIAGFSTTISNWIDQTQATDKGLGTPKEQLSASWSAFEEQYAKAVSGDRDALGSITQYADRVIDAQTGWSASGEQTQTAIDRVTGMLDRLPDQLSPEQFLADEFKAAIGELPAEIEQAILSTRYEIDSLISFAANTDDLPLDLRNLLKTNAHNLDATVDYIEGDNELTQDMTDLALNASNSYTTWLDYAVRDDDLTDKNRRIALQSGNDYQTWLDYAVRSDTLTDGDRTLALDSANSYAVHVSNILDSDITPDNRTLALESGNDYNVAVNAAMKGGLSQAIRELVFETGNDYTTIVDGILSADMTPDARKLALEDGNDFTTTMKASLEDGELTAREKALLDAEAADIARTLKVGGDLDLTDDQWAVIDAAEGTKKLEVLADVAFKSTDMQALGDIELNTRKVKEFFDKAFDGKNGMSVSMSANQNAQALIDMGYNIADQFGKYFAPHGTGLGVSLSSQHQPDGLRGIANVFKNVMGANGVDGSHAGGLDTVPYDGYRAELHKGEAVLTAAEAEAWRDGMSAPAISVAAPPVPSLPLLGQGDVVEVLNDLRRENRQLRDDLNRLLGESNDHAAASVRVSQAGFQQQIGATERGNKSLRKIQDRERMKELAR